MLFSIKIKHISPSKSYYNGMYISAVKSIKLYNICVCTYYYIYI